MENETKKSTKLKNLTKGIFVENPLFIGVLGTCPALATTKTLESALGMGILFFLVLICSNVLISLLRKLIPDEIRTPAYIVIIAGFVTIVKMLVQAFLPELYSTLGVFISLIVVNCIVLGRAEAFASKNGPLDSFLDAIGMGIGYTIALLIMAFFREILGTWSITIGKIFTFINDGNGNPLTLYIFGNKQICSEMAMSIFQTPPGGFIVFGCVMAVIGFIGQRKKELKFAKEKEARLIAAAKPKAPVTPVQPVKPVEQPTPVSTPVPKPEENKGGNQ